MVSCGFPGGFLSAYIPLLGVWGKLETPLRPQLTIQNVCAQHEHVHTLLKVLEKI